MSPLELTAARAEIDGCHCGEHAKAPISDAPGFTAFYARHKDSEWKKLRDWSVYQQLQRDLDTHDHPECRITRLVVLPVYRRIVDDLLSGNLTRRTRNEPITLDHLSERHRNILAATGWTKIGRNARCPCGSGKKFKRCCMNDPEDAK